eukprot:1262809-Pleurochrysis_carterae.AAC.1
MKDRGSFFQSCSEHRCCDYVQRSLWRACSPDSRIVVKRPTRLGIDVIVHGFAALSSDRFAAAQNASPWLHTTSFAPSAF